MNGEWMTPGTFNHLDGVGCRWPVWRFSATAFGDLKAQGREVGDPILSPALVCDGVGLSRAGASSLLTSGLRLSMITLVRTTVSAIFSTDGQWTEIDLIPEENNAKVLAISGSTIVRPGWEAASEPAWKALEAKKKAAAPERRRT